MLCQKNGVLKKALGKGFSSRKYCLALISALRFTLSQKKSAFTYK
jgi:hypothetical protein